MNRFGINETSLTVTSLGAVIGFISLWIMIRISRKQKLQLKSQENQLDSVKKLLDNVNNLSQAISERIFGTLSTFDILHDRLVDMLKEANDYETSKVWIMAYWMWFGIDADFPQKRINDLNHNDSKVWQLINVRADKNYTAFVVVYDPNSAKEYLKDFILVLLSYTLKKKFPKAESVQNLMKQYIDDKDVENLIKQYADDLRKFKDRLHLNSKVQIHPIDNIPLLLFATEIKGRYRGIFYLGEKEALKINAQTGGFYSEDSTMVQIFISHIENAIRLEKQNMLSPKN